MKLTVIGATGMVGMRLIAEATSRKHDLIAVARTPGTTWPAGTRPLRTDVSRPGRLDAAFESSEAAILAIRATAGSEDVIAPTTRHVLDSASRTGTRVLVIGGAGPLRSPHDPALRVIDDPRYVPQAWLQVAGASVSQLEACTEHGYQEWVYLSPPAVLEPGTRTGAYRRGTTTLLTAPDGSSRISAEDLAVAALDEIEHPGGSQHFTVAEAARVPESTVPAPPAVPHHSASERFWANTSG